MVLLKEFFEKVDFEKKSADNKKAWKITQEGKELICSYLEFLMREILHHNHNMISVPQTQLNTHHIVLAAGKNIHNLIYIHVLNNTWRFTMQFIQ